MQTSSALDSSLVSCQLNLTKKLAYFVSLDQLVETVYLVLRRYVFLRNLTTPLFACILCYNQFKILCETVDSVSLVNDVIKLCVLSVVSVLIHYSF